MFEVIPCPGSGCDLLVRKPGPGESVHCLCGQWIEGEKMTTMAIDIQQMDFVCFYCGKRKPYSVKFNESAPSCDCEGRKEVDRKNEMVETKTNQDPITHNFVCFHCKTTSKVTLFPGGTFICHCGMASITDTRIQEMSNKPKSILDGVPVEDKAFPLRGLTKSEIHQEEQSPPFEIVGSCPICGGPIYGRKLVNIKDKAEAKFTCTCRENKESQMEHLTK